MPGSDHVDLRQELECAYPALSDKDLLDKLLTAGIPGHLTAGSTVCDLGQRCTHLALIRTGRARIYQLAETGREITLYRVGAGECCILTVSCIMSGQAFPAIASCEEDLDVLLVPKDQVEAFMLEFPAWRRFVWKLLATRLADVLMLLEEVTFRRLDERLMRYLLHSQETGGSNDLKITHQMIADELGSAREVVSRLLKDMQQRGILSLARGHIIIKDPAKLIQTLALMDY